MSYFLINKLLFFGIKSSPLCSFCNLFYKTPFHVFYGCYHVRCLWSDLVWCFQNALLSPNVTAQTATFGILDSISNYFFFKNNKAFFNHVLLLFKLCIYKLKENEFINIYLITGISKVKRIEKEITVNNSKNAVAFTKSAT